MGGKRTSKALDPSIAEDSAFDERILGGGHFVEQVLNCSAAFPSEHNIALLDLVQRVAKQFQIVPATLHAPGKERQVVRAKALICHLAVRKFGIKGVEVASMLGYSSAAVSQAIKRGEAIMAADRELQKILDER